MYRANRSPFAAKTSSTSWGASDARRVRDTVAQSADAGLMAQTHVASGAYAFVDEDPSSKVDPPFDTRSDEKGAQPGSALDGYCSGGGTFATSTGFGQPRREAPAASSATASFEPRARSSRMLASKVEA